MKRIMLGIIGILLIGLVSIPVMAEEKNSDFFYADDNLTVENSIPGTSFMAGNNIDVSSIIDGMNFVAGNNISLSSKQDYLFSAGNSLSLEGVETKDAFLAGSTINLQQSKIRDLYAAAGTIRIDSDIVRNAYLGGDKVLINSRIGGNVYISAENIEIGENAIIEGTLKVPEGVNTKIANKDNIKEIVTYDGPKVDAKDTIIDTIKEKILSYLSITLIGIILLTANRRVFRQITKIKKDSSSIIKTALSGFGFLVLTPIACIILLCTVIGIPLSIITLLMYGIMIYLSIIPTAYFFGNWALKDKNLNEVLVLMISILVIFLLKLIPIVGGIVSFISLIMGLGIYLTLIIQFSKKMRK